PWQTGEQRLPALSPRRARLTPTNFSRLEYRLTPPSRGVFEVGPLALEYGDPFELVTGTVAAGATEPLVVVPGAVPLPESGLSIAAGDGSARLIQRRATG